MDNKIWLSSPHMGGTEMKYIQDAFDENWIAPLGPNVNGLEKDLEMYLGKDVHVAALSSGTAALHLALILLDIKPGDFVICQSLTFSASANPIIYVGAVPIFVDSEKDTWNLCPNAVEDAIKFGISKGKKPKAIITVSLYGMPHKVDEIAEISARYEIPIIEDSAEALGSTYKNQKCGTFGDLSVISFNGNKIITTSGGGALVVKNQEFKNKAVFLSTQAKDDAPHYEHTNIGYNYRMSNICAGIGRGQMEVLELRVQQRRQNHLFYKELLKDDPRFILHTEPNSDYFSNHWLNLIYIEPGQDYNRETIRQKFLVNNIETRPIWKPMHLQPIFKGSYYFGADLAEKLFQNGLCLPSGSNMTENDFYRISSTYKELDYLR
ncbi:DegT/DnrJ/EryC1/StrS family aminotransferase [Kaistella jeonii]|uniref:Pyridoxal phosphate-dependent aminotransferase n=1 Tax=Kaistella jeonii TaxID=266749 RepID=A0A0C1D5W4_9FLAO|nr:DegT/DnrJ/EryC1/StrS family aminotransferase [Kaistella jeonii]KIA89130.1 pyridoxal phosphate-dependent aminotransferase [Kaistella jeonii]SFB93643.1 dTDP-4-amino-4,6-dideoxygalactose transaminase [Kaistella jeonii]VEI97053.1 UDP-4-amino-4-deoxy-L-arabinose--oxoglutarate aminotransferase [Kaistella jeonii]